MSMFSFIKTLASAIPIPSAGKVALFVDSTTSIPMYKDETGAAHFLGGSGNKDFDEDPSTTSGLTWGHLSGAVRSGTSVVQVVAGTLTLTANATNYVEVTAAGIVSANITSFTAGSIPLRTIVTGATAITTSTDERAWLSSTDLLIPYTGATKDVDLGSKALSVGSIAWGTVHSIFGQPKFNINELTDLLYKADIRFTVTGGYSLCFNGDFDNGITLPASSASVINITVAGQSGVPATGYLYPQGKIYVSFYYTHNTYSAISMRVKNSGVWTILPTPVNVSNDTRFRVLCFTVGDVQYLTDIELTITTDATNSVELTGINYIPERWSSTSEPPFVSKYLPMNTLPGSLDVLKGMGVGTTFAKPAASASMEGKLWAVKSASGVADTLQICLKSAADTYSWIILATG